MQRIVIFIGIIGVLLAGMWLGVQRDSEVDARLTFSTTQIYNPGLKLFLERPLGIATSSFEAIVIKAPFENSSPETRAEIAYLHTLIDARTTSTVAAIRAEISIDAYQFGDITLSTLRTDPAYTNTWQLVSQSHYGFAGVIHQFKAQFDRVRPSYLDPSLSTVIDVPRHASYPRGHSSEAHLFALVLGALNPDQATVYIEGAAQVAYHREVAGLHYPSDSAAGAALATQYFEDLMAEDWWQELFRAAQAEWNNTI